MVSERAKLLVRRQNKKRKEDIIEKSVKYYQDNDGMAYCCAGGIYDDIHRNIGYHI